VSTVKHVVLTTCAVILALILASTETLAETPNERIIKSIADKAAFDRVFYTTMQTVIDSIIQKWALARQEQKIRPLYELIVILVIMEIPIAGQAMNCMMAQTD
jgi:uncharacterized membrane protein